MIIHLIVRLKKRRYCYIKMSYFPPYSHSRNKITGVDTSKFAKKIDLSNLILEVDKLNIGKLKKVPSGIKQFEK